ncbi:hypothetical protein C8R42DRAFT_719085 [Lentinula raphanica]|nr:hypothetical protein C8R42DRAFT_719085 [Lentinula raphanica]
MALSVFVLPLGIIFVLFTSAVAPEVFAAPTKAFFESELGSKDIPGSALPSRLPKYYPSSPSVAGADPPTGAGGSYDAVAQQMKRDIFFDSVLSTRALDADLPGPYCSPSSVTATAAAALRQGNADLKWGHRRPVLNARGEGVSLGPLKSDDPKSWHLALCKISTHIQIMSVEVNACNAEQVLNVKHARLAAFCDNNEALIRNLLQEAKGMQEKAISSPEILEDVSTAITVLTLYKHTCEHVPRGA